MRRAGDEAGLVGGQENHRRGNFLGFTDAALGLGQGTLLPGLAGRIQFGDFAQAMGRLHKTWADGIATNSLVPILGGNGAGQLQHGTLGHAIHGFQGITQFRWQPGRSCANIHTGPLNGGRLLPHLRSLR